MVSSELCSRDPKTLINLITTTSCLYQSPIAVYLCSLLVPILSRHDYYSWWLYSGIMVMILLLLSSFLIRSVWITFLQGISGLVIAICLKILCTSCKVVVVAGWKVSFSPLMKVHVYPSVSDGKFQSIPLSFLNRSCLWYKYPWLKYPCIFRGTSTIEWELKVKSTVDGQSPYQKSSKRGTSRVKSQKLDRWTFLHIYPA